MDGIEAQELALDFLMAEWEIAEADREWFSVLNCRWVKDSWYVVEIGVEGLPDKWVIQVYDTGECDPNYTFNSPISAASGTAELEEFPPEVAQMISKERQG
ncbi:hypothetical protein [Microseira sp. BLCC-F43]|jgi:hypothetical protein|uniref:hypothetical protein n=1 Tax=Microseira sp. BLCC-F43 TaxID=3153602 RepID=UPI0035BB3399